MDAAEPTTLDDHGLQLDELLTLLKMVIMSRAGKTGQQFDNAGWPGATIPLLTVFIPDVILVSIASWPGNLGRGTKLRRQEVQPCPGLR